MSRRSPADSGRLAARLPSVDPESIAAVVVTAGIGLAVGAVLFGAFAPSGRALVQFLYPLALLFPLVGATIVIGVCWWLWTDDDSSASPLLEGPPPETARSHADGRIGRETDRTLTDAAHGWYDCSAVEPTADVRRRLVEGAVRTLTTKRGLATERAREAVRTGTWTDDSVAAAFLADDLSQPPRERWRAAVDPGAAYTRRVSRTLAAIEAIDRATQTEVER